MADAEPVPAPVREMTAAEKRAARRARVLQGGENRLKLVTGQISTLKKESADPATALDREMDNALNELLDATDGTAPTSATTSVREVVGSADSAQSAEAALRESASLRPDPVQRRREAALRRQKKEAIVEQLLAPLQSNKTAPSAAAPFNAMSSSSNTVVVASNPAKPARATFSRHAFALRLHAFEERVIVLVILAAAVYLAMTIDLRTIATDLDVRDSIVISYQELFAQGLPLASIRQQMEREQLDAPVVTRIERLLASQSDAAVKATSSSPSVSFVSSFVPNVWDVSDYVASLVTRPPVILCVLLVRLLVAGIATAVHAAFQLPDVKTPQDDDLGFVANLALSSRPAFKGYVIKLRKSLDDVFLFLYVLLLAVALRAIYAATFA